MSSEITYLDVPKGTTAKISFGLGSGDVVSPGWTCDIQLRDTDTGVLMGVDRNVTDVSGDNLEFVVELTAVETDIIPARYILAAELTNASTGEVLEGLQGINICQDWVY